MSIALTVKELAQMRADIEYLMPDTCDILSVAYTSDGEKGAMCVYRMCWFAV